MAKMWLGKYYKLLKYYYIIKIKYNIKILQISFNYIYIYIYEARWRSWFRYCATSRKVAGSILDWVIEIFR